VHLVDRSALTEVRFGSVPGLHELAWVDDLDADFQTGCSSVGPARAIPLRGKPPNWVSEPSRSTNKCAEVVHSGLNHSTELRLVRLPVRVDQRRLDFLVAECMNARKGCPPACDL
jgi:hypothetical protein